MQGKSESAKEVKASTPSKRVKLSAEVIESHRQEHGRRVNGPAKIKLGGE